MTGGGPPGGWAYGREGGAGDGFLGGREGPCRTGGLWHATCSGSADMKTSHYRTVLGALVALVLFHLQLTGCLHGRAQCGSVDWVDRVEDRWLVVVDRGGASHTYRRSSDRETWVEGDALVDGLLRPDCRLAMRAEIERLRDELIR